MKANLKRIIESDIEEVEMNIDMLAQTLTTKDRENWIMHFNDAMNDRSSFHLIGRYADYANPSSETIARLKLLALYEVI